MNDLRKLAEQAMEYLADYTVGESPNASAVNDLIADLEAALAQPEQEPEQEPVAWRYDEATYRPDDLRGRQWHFNLFSTHKPYADHMVQNVTPLYAHPPQRKPLTEDEISEIAMDCSFVSESDTYFARAIEKAHGIE